MMAFQGYSNGDFTISNSKVKALSNKFKHGADILLSTIPTSPIGMNVLNLEECELLSDSKYRAYISQVDKALKNFEYTSEWADLISALGKLNKVCSFSVLQ
ncbi:hypothetical protein LSH36_220g03048 [Paralvinella palmiformis]|uniref:DOP1 N-terminal domain-containing protein n=1 Tax=Paralvinella palmiformis TaxID=53620 RepID=A0AAD9N3V0_9ANNE|nr:hypothetical protein LSH36_220g03048 [Paralvinella palmiformis]